VDAIRNVGRYCILLKKFRFLSGQFFTVTVEKK